ncbi:MAG: zinc metallopeptidase [Ruminococcaceae bacterium]|mgnify:FL=1|nr:zinc metallopeptidase [Oscillospiraceae bacterium]
MFFGYYYDIYYFILVIPVFIISLIIQAKMKSTFSQYSRVVNSRRITGAQAAEMVLRYYNIQDVRIERINGSLTDCYDPMSKVIKLSDSVYDNPSIAAVGVACHEAGHAAQHAEKYVPIRIRNYILPVCNIGSKISIPLLIAGVIFSARPIIWIGIGLFAFTAIFQTVTLPVEFNASNRALNVIESTGILSYEEKRGAGKVLKMAAMTYVAALAMSLAQLLRLILRYGGNRRR